ncbi:hypothetical protein [Methanosarcina sp. WWM596]|uniref:hypothetical protein n=1 Tax=Methanosarcina sp. WWM596 TaxID=1434103 RepID=UPI00061560F7|nr:hypothetical protein [Methanosarcina sp. WWM596]AKB19842.1 hypothetical protein MSWHS_2979 [Methanosarcina sp. WWM596]
MTICYENCIRKFGEESAIDALRKNKDCENETLRLIIADILYEVETWNPPETVEEVEEPLEENFEPTEVKKRWNNRIGNMRLQLSEKS